MMAENGPSGSSSLRSRVPLPGQVRKKKSQVSGTVRDSVLTDCHGIPLLSSVGICIEVGLSV